MLGWDGRDGREALRWENYSPFRRRQSRVPNVRSSTFYLPHKAVPGTPGKADRRPKVHTSRSTRAGCTGALNSPGALKPRDSVFPQHTSMAAPPGRGRPTKPISPALPHPIRAHPGESYHAARRYADSAPVAPSTHLKTTTITLPPGLPLSSDDASVGPTTPSAAAVATDPSLVWEGGEQPGPLCGWGEAAATTPWPRRS